MSTFNAAEIIDELDNPSDDPRRLETIRAGRALVENPCKSVGTEGCVDASQAVSVAPVASLPAMVEKVGANDPEAFAERMHKLMDDAGWTA